MQKALGLIETIGLVTAIEAADTAVKAANVTLLGYENAKGGGKITVKFVGDVGSVQAAVAAGAAAAARIGKVYSCHVIPRPHDEIAALIRQVDRGRPKEQPVSPPVVPATEATPAPEPEAVLPTSAPAEPPAEAPNGAGTPAQVPSDAPTPEAVAAPAVTQCIAITKSGERCALSARPGSQYCSVHRKLEQSPA